MNDENKVSSVGVFFKKLLGLIIVLAFIAACVIMAIDKYKNIAAIKVQDYSSFTVTFQWIEAALFAALAIVLLVLLIIANKSAFQKWSKNKHLQELQALTREQKQAKNEEIEQLKISYEKQIEELKSIIEKMKAEEINSQLESMNQK
jgi:hypothetical protein